MQLCGKHHETHLCSALPSHLETEGLFRVEYRMLQVLGKEQLSGLAFLVDGCLGEVSSKIHFH